MNHYNNTSLNNLLSQSSATNEYFNSLPGYIQDMIAQRRQNLKSEDELRGYAEYLLQGDR